MNNLNLKFKKYYLNSNSKNKILLCKSKNIYAGSIYRKFQNRKKKTTY